MIETYPMLVIEDPVEGGYTVYLFQIYPDVSPAANDGRIFRQ